MGTEDETQLSMQARATAAAGAALVAACIVNPLDVIKTRIQAQAMAESSSQRGCSTPWTCSSTLYEHAAHRGLQYNHCQSLLDHSQHHPATPCAATTAAHARHTHTLTAETTGWLTTSNSSSNSFSRFSGGSRPAAAAAAMSAVRSAAADKAAAAAAAFRRWGITEGPLPIRRTPPFPVPYGWTPAPITAAAAAGSCQCIPQQAAAAAGFPSNSMWEMAKSISAKEGLPVLWRGTWASLLIAVPMVGIYMPLYDTLLHSWSVKLGSIAPVVSGTAARTIACFCVAPFELLRTRLQASAESGISMRSAISSFVTEQHVHNQQQHSTTAAGAAAKPQQLMVQQQQLRPVTVLRAVPRMWTGFSATLVRDVPFSAMYWALVEPLRQAMLPLNSHWQPLQQLANMRQHGHAADNSSSSGRQSSSSLHSQQPVHHTQLEILVANMTSGFIAGGVAAGLTTPFDVVKTRMQIATPAQQQQLAGGSSSSSGNGIRVFNILRDVYRKEGAEGLFSGLKPRAYRAAPACAIVISVYELLKAYLTPA